MRFRDRGGGVGAPRRQPWPTWVLTALVALTAGAAWSSVAHLRAPPAPWRVPWLLLAAGFAAGHVVAVRFEFSGEAHVATLSEVPLLVGLVFAGTDRLLVATVVGTAVGALWRRQAPIKAAFNTAVRAVETVVAAGCFHAVLGHGGALSGRGWLAAFVAVPAANLASAVCVQVAIALSVGRFNPSGLRTLAVVLAGVAVVNVAVGRIAVALLWADPVAVVPFLGIAVVLGVGYRAHSRLRQRHGDLEQVYRFSRAVAGLAEGDAVIQAVLSEAKTLLRSGRAEFALRGPDGDILYTLSGDGLLVSSGQQGAHPFRGPVAAAEGGVLASAATKDPDLVEAMTACGFRDAVAAPVHCDGGPDGIVVVADRLSDRVTFEAADLELVEALASHTAMALRSSELLDRLRLEVAAKDHQASHDALTGLGNRTLFAEQVEVALAQRGGESVVAVMLMDLDRFKEVNDTLGHHTGDLMLQQIAVQLTKAVGDKGSVARLGGDEFAFVIPASTRAEVAAVAQDVLARGQATVLVEGLRLEVRASLGVAVVPDHGSDRSTLLRRADIAMYHAKTNGTSIEFYEPGLDPHSSRRLGLASELRLVLDTQWLELCYQPKAEILTGQVNGVEAFLRWTPSTGRSLPTSSSP